MDEGVRLLRFQPLHAPLGQAFAGVVFVAAGLRLVDALVLAHQHQRLLGPGRLAQ